MFQLTLCLLQLLDTVLLLPPILNTHHVIWLNLVTLPLMTVSMMNSPRDNSIMKKALGKNKKHLTKQVKEDTNMNCTAGQGISVQNKTLTPRYLGDDENIQVVFG